MSVYSWLALSPVQKFVDFCEIVTGKELCLPNGKTLTPEDRAFTAVGMLIGSSAFWKEVSNAKKVFGATKVGGFASKIYESAAKLFGKTPIKEELIGLGELIKATGNKIDDFAGVIKGKLIRFGPMNGGGPLRKIDLKDGSGIVADTFRSSSYFQNTIEEPIKLYRVYGGESGQIGSYWSRVKPSGPMQATIDSALDPTWGNSAKKWVEITVPKNITVFEGITSAASLKGGASLKVGELLGGGSQVYIQEVNPSWVTNSGGF